jgi:hypothetical protein
LELAMRSRHWYEATNPARTIQATKSHPPSADIVAVAAWLGDTVETVCQTYAHSMPGADDHQRQAIGQFFRRPGREGSALNVPSDGAK